MTLTESSPIISSSLGDASAERCADRVVVWVSGEHDVSTAAALWETVVGAIALDNTDLVLDLSGVLFMDASTIGVIVRLHEGLRRRSGSLALRSPSACARRLLDICGLAGLIDTGPVEVASMPRASGALRSWVVVPAADRVDRLASGRPVRP